MKAKTAFALFILSMQKGKLTKFQIILMEWFFGWVFFSLFCFITGKGEGINMLWINLK